LEIRVEVPSSGGSSVKANADAVMWVRVKVDVRAVDLQAVVLGVGNRVQVKAEN
jgi:hypothetical protein